MNHHDHVRLLEPARLTRGGRWADLGAGAGAFTLALRELTGAKAEIYAVDRNEASLRQLERAYTSRFGGLGGLRSIEADFAVANHLPHDLDGVLMANSLHFFKDKLRALKRVHDMLKPSGTLLLVEYNVDQGNPWVPHPISYRAFEVVAGEGGFESPRLLGTHPSNFLREFYSAAAVRAR